MANEIPISVVDRKIKVGRHVPATMTNIGKDYLSISLDNEWSNTAHRLRVTLYSEAPYVSVQDWWDGKSSIEIPQEITSCPAFKVTVALISEDGYERLITQAMDEPIENPRNGHDEGAEPSPATLDVVSRIDALAADLEEKRDTDYWRGKPGKDADIAGAEAAKDAANKAAANAESKAAIATAAAQNASEKASLAASKAVEAESAANVANEAATNANNATLNANEATENANNAASNATEAAINANNAATNANDSATNANNAATLANEAADNANETANQIKQRADSGEFNGKDGSDASATDVRINGTSITVDGVADIPIAVPSGSESLIRGVVGIGSNNLGITVTPNGILYVTTANKPFIDMRVGEYSPISSALLDYAVKAAMTDGKGAAWTADEQKAARERMNAADANKVYIMQKQIENLQGIVATEETDSTEAYTKTVPTGAQKWASLDKVGGKTIVWNQLVNNFRSGTTSDAGLTFANNGDGSFTINGTVGDGDLFHWLARIDVVHVGRKYAILGSSKNVRLYLKGYNNQQSANGEACIMSVIENTSDMYFYCRYDFGAVINNEIVRPQLIDLTQMFGAGNEPTSLDDPRIAFIKAYAEEHPEYNPGELMSAEVVEVESKGTFLIPQSVREMCPGYGWSAGSACNEIDFGRKVYVQRVGSVDMGTLDWIYSNSLFHATLNIKQASTYDARKDGFVCDKYQADLQISVSFDKMSDKTMLRFDTVDFIFVKDTAYTDVETFKAAVAGHMLQYELAEPIEVDLSDVLSDDNFIEVEAGGTVTFKQASTQLPVPSSVTYQISTSEVIANA